MKTRLLIIFTIGIIGFTSIPYSYASCAAPLLEPPGPCFDSFSMFTDTSLTEKSIMENYARNIELNYGDWHMSNRNWDNEDKPLNLPAIICTEFVADGIKQYRMAKWVDSQTISSFENHRDDSLCDKWLPPIDDGVKIRWDKPNYLSNDVGALKVDDKDMNLDYKKIDSFDIHVWSDIDHKGIELTVTETDIDNGIFEGTVFFTPEDESIGTRLLVEDAVYADHKSNVGSARIINESEDIILDESHVDDFRATKNPNECWYQDDDGNIIPCTIDSTGPSMIIGMFLVVFWPYIVLGISIGIIFIVWRKRK